MNAVPPDAGRVIRRAAFHGGGEEVAADIREKYGYDGDLLDLFVGAEGPTIHKWHHYIPLYERYLAPWRNRPLRFLEIGVSAGGSLWFWRKLFGPEATIFGVDINPDCAAQDGRWGQVRIGSQDDPHFLHEVVDEMGGVDVVLDDGSHVMRHIQASLEALFPRVSTGGLYMIEDLHCAYWPEYGGGVGQAGPFELLPRIVADMHRPYHGGDPLIPALAGRVSGVHVHDSILVLEKDAVHPPVHSRRGGDRE